MDLKIFNNHFATWTTDLICLKSPLNNVKKRVAKIFVHKTGKPNVLIDYLFRQSKSVTIKNRPIVDKIDSPWSLRTILLCSKIERFRNFCGNVFPHVSLQETNLFYQHKRKLTNNFWYEKHSGIRDRELNCTGKSVKETNSQSEINMQSSWLIAPKFFRWIVDFSRNYNEELNSMFNSKIALLI